MGRTVAEDDMRCGRVTTDILMMKATNPINKSIIPGVFVVKYIVSPCLTAIVVTDRLGNYSYRSYSQLSPFSIGEEWLGKIHNKIPVRDSFNEALRILDDLPLGGFVYELGKFMGILNRLIGYDGVGSDMDLGIRHVINELSQHISEK